MSILLLLGFIVGCVACLYAKGVDEARAHTVKYDADMATRKGARAEHDDIVAELEAWRAASRKLD